MHSECNGEMMDERGGANELSTRLRNTEERTLDETCGGMHRRVVVNKIEQFVPG